MIFSYFAKCKNRCVIRRSVTLEVEILKGVEMMNSEAKKTSVWGKISVTCSLAAFLAGVFLTLTAFVLSVEFLLIVSFGVTLLLIIAGILSGLVGLITNGDKLGLILNVMIILIAFLGLFVVYSLFSYCCAPPPRF